MKIDSNSLPSDPARVTGAQTAAGGPVSGKSSAQTASSSDAVQVSSGAQIAAEATRQLADISRRDDDVRSEVVERAKAAVANGEVGADLDALADTIIDGLLGD